MNWFSCQRPSPVDKGTWSACLTAMGEAFENTIYHARDPLKTEPQTRVEVTITTGVVQIQIWDNGPGFNFEQYMKALPKIVPLHTERGRGLWIISQIADYLHYSQTANQLNCFTIQKNWSPSSRNVEENEPPLS